MVSIKENLWPDSDNNIDSRTKKHRKEVLQRVFTNIVIPFTILSHFYCDKLTQIKHLAVEDTHQKHSMATGHSCKSLYHLFFVVFIDLVLRKLA